MRLSLFTYLFLGLCIQSQLYALLPINILSDPTYSYANQIKGVKKYIDQIHVEPIYIESKENAESDKTLTRKGFLALRPNAIGTVICCHGYTSSKHESFFFKTFFPNFNALTFDFRAHGDLTDGQQSTIGAEEIYDVEAAVKYVREHPELKDKPIIGFGFSMGAVSLLRAQAHWKNLFDLLILDSPFDSSDDCMSKALEEKMTVTIFSKKYKLPGKTLIMKALYNERWKPIIRRVFRFATGFDPDAIPTRYVRVAPIDTAKDIKVPCFFISCAKDKKVPFDSVKRLYHAVDAPFKRMWITQGIMHCSAYLTNPELYWYNMNKFIRKVFEKDMFNKEKIIDDRVTITMT